MWFWFHFLLVLLCVNAPIHIGITLFVHLNDECSMLVVFAVILWSRIFFSRYIPCNMVLLYLLIVYLLFYLRVLMNAFNMFFVSFCCFFYSAVHLFTFTPIFLSLHFPSTFPSSTHNDVFLTIERKQITQKSIIEHV